MPLDMSMPYVHRYRYLRNLSLRIEILRRRDAMHVRAQLVHGLHPLLVLIRVKHNTAAYRYIMSVSHSLIENELRVLGIKS